MKPGDKVVLDDGRRGWLQNPRGCFCGPNGEACWDIALKEDGSCGVQAHGGTFRVVMNCTTKSCPTHAKCYCSSVGGKCGRCCLREDGVGCSLLEPGLLVLCVAGGGFAGQVLVLVKRLTPGDVPDFMEGSATPVWFCRRLRNDECAYYSEAELEFLTEKGVGL